MPVQCTCLTCSKSFTIPPSGVALGRGRYCSRACADVGRMTIVTMVCEQCATSFDRPINRSRGAARQFCSEACAGLARRSRVDLICEKCGKAFTRNTAAVATGRGRFCSRECVNAAQENKVSLNCETCGTTFERKASAVQARTFCSDGCARLKNAQPVVMDDDGVTAEIPLMARDGTVKEYAVIDATDAEWASHWQWYLSTKGYVVRGQGIFLHRELLGLEHGNPLFGDHIDKNPLNNRRNNLRPASPSESPQNVPGRPGTSQYRGVAWNEDRHLWHAYVNVGGVRVFSEFFATEEEATRAARAARARFMPFAVD